MPMSFVMPDKSFPTHVALALFLPLHCVGTRLACPSQTVTALDPTLTGHAVGRVADEALRVIVATCGVLALPCMYLCMCVCIYVCMYVLMYVCTYLYL